MRLSNYISIFFFYSPFSQQKVVTRGIYLNEITNPWHMYVKYREGMNGMALEMYINSLSATTTITATTTFATPTTCERE